MRLLERRDEVDALEHELALPSAYGIEAIRRHGAIGHVGGAVDLEDAALVEALEQVTKAVHDHLVGDDQHALAAVLARDGLDDAAQAQDHVAPALAARRAEIELADMPPLLR